MTRDEAYDILCKHVKEKPVVVSEYEYVKWFGFRIAPEGTKINGDRLLVGPMMLVDKDSGKVLTEDDVDREDLSLKIARDMRRQYLIDKIQEEKKRNGR